MLFKLEESDDYAAFPVGVTQEEAELFLRRGKKRKVKISGIIAISAITATTILLLFLNQASLAPVATIGVLIFGLSLLKFYNSTVELFGGRLFRKRLRHHEAQGKLVWVPAALKLRMDSACKYKGIAMPAELFSYNMAASRNLAVLYRQLKTRKKRQQSEPLQKQIIALIDNHIAT